MYKLKLNQSLLNYMVGSKATDENDRYMATKVINYPKKCRLQKFYINGSTTFSMACRTGRNRTALAILQHQPDSLNLTKIDSNGKNAIMYALQMELVDVVMAILDYEECGIDAIDINGNTPLIYACAHGLGSVVVKMLQNHYDRANVTHKNKYGQWAFFWMCYIKKRYLINYMIKNHPNGCMFETNDINGVSVLTLLTHETTVDYAMLILEKYSSVIDIDIETKDGDTALIIACKLKLHNLAMKLLENNANVSIYNNIGRDALYYANRNKMVEVVATIINELDMRRVASAKIDPNIIEKAHGIMSDAKVNMLRLCYGKDIMINNYIQPESECIVCHEEGECYTNTTCGHIFDICGDCVKYVSGGLCPICRSDVNLIKSYHVK